MVRPGQAEVRSQKEGLVRRAWGKVAPGQTLRLAHRSLRPCQCPDSEGCHSGLPSDPPLHRSPPRLRMHRQSPEDRRKSSQHGHGGPGRPRPKAILESSHKPRPTSADSRMLFPPGSLACPNPSSTL